MTGNDRPGREGSAGARWRRIEPLLDRALELPPERVTEFLDDACRDEPELRAELDALLRAEHVAGAFLSIPALELAPELLEPQSVSGEVPEPAAEGSRIGPWRIVREVGRGGMGAVYLAERADGGFEQKAALKLIQRGLDTDEVLARFRQERQILARLEHANIARLLDGGATEDGHPYLAMEFVEGEPLTSYGRDRRLDLGAVLGLFIQVCRAVEYAHRNLVIHRDLKPGNVLVTEDRTVKLLDFGIAKVLGPGRADGETLTMGPRLTPRYAAPEQVRGEPPTTATDVYALGVILYELLTGTGPYRLPTGAPGELERAILEQDPVTPSAALGRLAGDRAHREESGGWPSWRDRLQGDLDNIVLTALRKEPERRYSSAEALREDLERFLARLPVRATPPTFAYRTAKFVGRNRVAVVAGVIVALSLIGGLVATAWQARVAARERDRALLEAQKASEIKDFTMSLFEVSDPAESRGAGITARDLLERGTVRVDRELAGQPAVRAEMLQVLARIYYALGELGRAESLAVRSVDLARRLPARGREQLASSLHWLGVVRREQGDYDRARQALAEALAIRDGLGKARRNQYAETLGEMATLHHSAGRPESSVVLYRRVLDIDRQVLGERHAEVATDLENMAMSLSDSDRAEEAIPLLRQALGIRLETLGRNHPLTASTLSALGVALSALSRYAEADSCYTQALRIRLATLGPNHYDVAYSYYLIAKLEMVRGDYPAAYAMYEKALAIHRGVRPDHPFFSRDLNELAILYYQRGEYSLALERFREALAIRGKTLPADDRGSLTMEHNIGCVLRNMGRYAEAERILRDARERRRRAFGAKHLDVANSDHHIGILLHWTGRDDEAERLMRAALAMRAELIGDSHQVTAQTAEALATLLRDRGGHRESEELYHRAVAINARVFPEPSPQSAEAFVGLGRLLLLAQRPAEAEPWLRQALAVRRDGLGDQDPRTAEAAVALGLCRGAQGAPAEAKALLSASLPVLGSQPGRRDPLAKEGERALERARTLARR